MKKKNENVKPSYYKEEEMEKPLSELMEGLRRDVSEIRGKLGDIRRIYGWEEWIDHLEGGMSCMLISMYSTTKEWQKFEERQKSAQKS